jgi:hypothetical protein
MRFARGASRNGKRIDMDRKLSFTVALVVIGSMAVEAQIAVYDPAVTARNSVTAVLKAYLVNLQREQGEQLRRMSQRLSVFTNLDKYALTDIPQWRIHIFFDAPEEDVLFARDYHAALNYGDASGQAYLGVTVPLLDVSPVTEDGVDGRALRDFASRLATINVADATAISATNDAGQVRYNGRRELDAIDHLQSDVIDPSQDQSATAVIEKLSGASLIGARQRQARADLLVGIVEQLLVDSKRSRDTEASLMNMQLTTWRSGRTANDAFVSGTGDALRTWRQP